MLLALMVAIAGTFATALMPVVDFVLLLLLLQSCRFFNRTNACLTNCLLSVVVVAFFLLICRTIATEMSRRCLFVAFVVMPLYLLPSAFWQLVISDFHSTVDLTVSCYKCAHTRFFFLSPLSLAHCQQLSLLQIFYFCSLSIFVRT